MFSKLLLSTLHMHREVCFKNTNRVCQKVLALFMEHNGGFSKYYVMNDYPHQTLAV